MSEPFVAVNDLRKNFNGQKAVDGVSFTIDKGECFGVLSSLILAPLGGCWWPLFITPKWMQNMALFTPHGCATTSFNKLLLYGGNFHDVIPGMPALAGFGLAFAVIAVTRFRTSSV